MQAWLAQRKAQGSAAPPMLTSLLPGSGDDAAGVRVVNLPTPLPLRLSPSERHVVRMHRTDLAAWGFSVEHVAAGA